MSKEHNPRRAALKWLGETLFQLAQQKKANGMASDMGHDTPKPLPSCACGCGQLASGRLSPTTGEEIRYCRGHQHRKGCSFLEFSERESICAQLAASGRWCQEVDAKDESGRYKRKLVPRSPDDPHFGAALSAALRVVDASPLLRQILKERL
jgi:hypothetical protein